MAAKFQKRLERGAKIHTAIQRSKYSASFWSQFRKFHNSIRIFGKKWPYQRQVVSIWTMHNNWSILLRKIFLVGWCCRLSLSHPTFSPVPPRLRLNHVFCEIRHLFCCCVVFGTLNKNFFFSPVTLFLICLENPHHIIWSNQAGSFPRKTVFNIHTYIHT